MFEQLPPERRTITAARMVATVDRERTRIKRIKAWNQKLKDEQDAANR
jgi:hypothetical protein